MKQKIEIGIAKDANGNVYKTVKIGSKEWFADNLKVDTLKNGQKIKEVIPIILKGWQINSENQQHNDEWHQSDSNKEPAFTYLSANRDFEKHYGKLYNFWAIKDSNGIGFDGFRLPKTEDFFELREILGESSGRQLKSKNIPNDPNKTNWGKTADSKLGNDKIQFNGLPSGCGGSYLDQINGIDFDFYNKYAMYWLDNTETLIDDNGGIDPLIACLWYGNDDLYIGKYSGGPGIMGLKKTYALSIRLVRDL